VVKDLLAGSHEHVGPDSQIHFPYRCRQPNGYSLVAKESSMIERSMQPAPATYVQFATRAVHPQDLEMNLQACPALAFRSVLNHVAELCFALAKRYLQEAAMPRRL